jgi:polar amino acid transport system ATP-binding protein
MTALVDIADVTKSFGQTQVLHGINLSIQEHQIVSLVGASGCGKSTLLRCINALEGIDSGTISLAGEQVSGPGADLNHLRRQVGIVFQSYNLFPHMSVVDNITLAPRRVLKTSREQARVQALRLLERIGLQHKADAFPDRLSGGQQQRVAIARALAMNPRLLLLDEVTSALDPQLVGEVLAIIRELAADGMTMILATHEMDFARDVSDVVCFLEGGRICEAGPPDQVLRYPADERTRAFLRRRLAAHTA